MHTPEWYTTRPPLFYTFEALHTSISHYSHNTWVPNSDSAVYAIAQRLTDALIPAQNFQQVLGDGRAGSRCGCGGLQYASANPAHASTLIQRAEHNKQRMRCFAAYRRKLDHFQLRRLCCSVWQRTCQGLQGSVCIEVGRPRSSSLRHKAVTTTKCLSRTQRFRCCCQQHVCRIYRENPLTT